MGWGGANGLQAVVGIFFFTGPVLLVLSTIFCWIAGQFFPMMVCSLSQWKSSVHSNSRFCDSHSTGMRIVRSILALLRHATAPHTRPRSRIFIHG